MFNSLKNIFVKNSVNKANKKHLVFSNDEWLFLLESIYELRGLEYRESIKARENNISNEDYHNNLCCQYYNLAGNINKQLNKDTKNYKESFFCQIFLTNDDINLLVNGITQLRNKHEELSYQSTYTNTELLNNRNHVQLEYIFTSFLKRISQQA